jgi:hypothetical protein
METALAIPTVLPTHGGPVFDRIFRLGVNAGLAILAVIVVIAVLAVAKIQSVAQTSASPSLTTANLKVVPTLRSVTVSAAAVNFSRCHHGTPPRRSTKIALGFPYGHCYIGRRGTDYPITITNGLEARILVGSSNAVPVDGGKQWVPCRRVARPAAVACAGPGKQPGQDQFVLQNFSRYTQNELGLSKAMLCDGEFGPSGDCIAVTGQVEREGVALIGPSKPDDNSRTWTVTITWMAAPLS